MTLTTNLSTQRTSAKGGARRLLTSFTRPADITAYTAGDVINGSTSATVLGFVEAGAGGTIGGVSVVMGETDTSNLKLLVFDTEPTNFADNAALSLVAADVDKLVGIWDFANADKVSIGTDLEYYSQGSLPQGLKYTSDNGKLYALLVTMTAYTPASEAVFSISLHIEDNE